MNTLILIFLLSICLILSIKICNGDILDPVPLSFSAFLMTSIISFVRNGLWGLDISFETIIIITTALCTFALGYIITKQLLYPLPINEFNNHYSILKIPKRKWNIILIFIMSIVFYLSLEELIRLAATVVLNPDASNAMMSARNAAMFNEVKRNFVVTIAAFASSAAGYFYTYILIVNRASDLSIFKYFTRHWDVIIIIILSLLTAALGTGRTFLIKYIVFVLIIAHYNSYIRRKIKHYSWKEVFRFIKIMIICIGIFFGLFQLLGMTTGKTGTLSATEMLNGYSGAALIAFDRSVDLYTPDHRFWGEECFNGLYGLLNSLGFEIPNNIHHLPFVYFEDGSSTNIYTSLRSYIYDFGFNGLYIVQFIIGIVSAIAYVALKKLGNFPTYLLIYSIFIYGIVMQGIAEIILRNFLSITNAFLVIFFYIFCILYRHRLKIGKLSISFHG